MPDMYAILLASPAQAVELETALTDRRKLLQHINKTAVVNRNMCLKRDQNDEARRIEEVMSKNDVSMEAIDGLLDSIKEARR
jgi:hypothetical protein